MVDPDGEEVLRDTFSLLFGRRRVIRPHTNWFQFRLAWKLNLLEYIKLALIWFLSNFQAPCSAAKSSFPRAYLALITLEWTFLHARHNQLNQGCVHHRITSSSVLKICCAKQQSRWPAECRRTASLSTLMGLMECLHSADIWRDGDRAAGVSNLGAASASVDRWMTRKTLHYWTGDNYWWKAPWNGLISSVDANYALFVSHSMHVNGRSITIFSFHWYMIQFWLRLCPELYWYFGRLLKGMICRCRTRVF